MLRVFFHILYIVYERRFENPTDNRIKRNGRDTSGVGHSNTPDRDRDTKSLNFFLIGAPQMFDYMLLSTLKDVLSDFARFWRLKKIGVF